MWKGGSGRISKMWNSDTNWATISHTTNSVYFDGESLPMYNANLTGTEGGQNLLVRWYSKEAPGKNEVVFLQLKAYQEAWVGPKSYKRKVAILQRDMNQFVKLDGIMWSQDLAKEIVLRARPTLTEDKLDTAVNMLLECRQCLITKQLSPCVRTTFSRITFQSLPVGPQAASSLKLNLDHNVTFVDEQVNEQRRPSRSSWHLPDDADLDKQGVARLPCAVLEVKVSGDPKDGQDLPHFVKGLLASGVLEDVSKFSKQLTATAAFHRGEKILSLPHWAELPLFQPLFQSNGRKSDFEESSVGLSVEEHGVELKTVEKESFDNEIVEKRENKISGGGADAPKIVPPPQSNKQKKPAPTSKVGSVEVSTVDIDIALACHST